MSDEGRGAAQMKSAPDARTATRKKDDQQQPGKGLLLLLVARCCSFLKHNKPLIPLFPRWSSPENHDHHHHHHDPLLGRTQGKLKANDNHHRFGYLGRALLPHWTRWIRIIAANPAVLLRIMMDHTTQSSCPIGHPFLILLFPPDSSEVVLHPRHR